MQLADALSQYRPEFKIGEDALAIDGAQPRLSALDAVLANPYGWDRVAPQKPLKPKGDLADWLSTPILPGQRGGLFPSGTDIYGREVTAVPKPFINAVAGAQNIGDSVSAAAKGEMGRSYTDDEFQTASGQMMDLAGLAALGTAPAQYATMPANSVGTFAGRMARTKSGSANLLAANDSRAGVAATAVNAGASLEQLYGEFVAKQKAIHGDNSNNWDFSEWKSTENNYRQSLPSEPPLTTQQLSKNYDRSASLADALEKDTIGRAAPEQPAANTDYLSALKSAGVSKTMFESVLSRIKSDASIPDGNLIDLAVKYRGGGERPKTREEAIALLSQRALELRRDNNKLLQAKSARPF